MIEREKYKFLVINLFIIVLKQQYSYFLVINKQKQPPQPLPPPPPPPQPPPPSAPTVPKNPSLPARDLADDSPSELPHANMMVEMIDRVMKIMKMRPAEPTDTAALSFKPFSKHNSLAMLLSFLVCSSKLYSLWLFCLDTKSMNGSLITYLLERILFFITSQYLFKEEVNIC